MRLTMPQILMLNHAAVVNRARLDARTRHRQDTGTMTMEDVVNTMPLFNGKPINELTSEEYAQYLAS